MDSATQTEQHQLLRRNNGRTVIGTFPCPEPNCTHIATTRPNLNRHLQTHKTTRNGYPCRFANCAKVYLSSASRSRHHREKHRHKQQQQEEEENEEVLPTTTKVCVEVAPRKQRSRLLAVHAEIEKNVQCSECKKWLASRSNLARHRHRFCPATRSSSKLQKCVECDSYQANVRSCIECADDFCQSCFERCHAKGNRRNHRWRGGGESRRGEGEGEGREEEAGRGGGERRTDEDEYSGFDDAPLLSLSPYLSPQPQPQPQPQSQLESTPARKRKRTREPNTSRHRLHRVKKALQVRGKSKIVRDSDGLENIDDFFIHVDSEEGEEELHDSMLCTSPAELQRIYQQVFALAPATSRRNSLVASPQPLPVIIPRCEPLPLDPNNARDPRNLIHRVIESSTPQLRRCRTSQNRSIHEEQEQEEEVDDRQVRTFLRDRYHLEVHYTPAGDGNCQFRAVAYERDGHVRGWKQVKQNMLDQVMNVHFIRSALAVNGSEQSDEGCRKIGERIFEAFKDRDEYGDMETLALLAYLSDIRFHFVSVSRRQGSETSIATLLQVFHDEFHSGATSGHDAFIGLWNRHFYRLKLIEGYSRCPWCGRQVGREPLRLGIEMQLPMGEE